MVSEKASMPQPHHSAKKKNEGNIMETRSASDIEKSTQKLLEDLKEVVRDGEELLRAGAEDLSERSAAAREKLAAALEAAKETQEKMREQVIVGARATDRAIRQHPYQAIGIALGVGLLIGVLAARR
jgi:ElaB/YqjD/DUF883 family membrane-anchored ribosome-binding protein